jgi:hypothetical protein
MGHLTPALRSKATSGGAALSPFDPSAPVKRGEEKRSQRVGRHDVAG